MLSKVASNTIFLVFGMTWPRIEPRSSRPLTNILLIKPMAINSIITKVWISTHVHLLASFVCYICYSEWGQFLKICKVINIWLTKQTVYFLMGYLATSLFLVITLLSVLTFFFFITLTFISQIIDLNTLYTKPFLSCCPFWMGWP